MISHGVSRGPCSYILMPVSINSTILKEGQDQAIKMLNNIGVECILREIKLSSTLLFNMVQRGGQMVQQC